jgi:hypothetical protein
MEMDTSRCPFLRTTEAKRKLRLFLLEIAYGNLHFRIRVSAEGSKSQEGLHPLA